MKRTSFPNLALYVLLVMPATSELSYAFWNSINEVLSNK